MGKDLAERFPEAAAVFRAVDDALGTPLSRLMFEGPEDELTQTHNAQPAILAHSAAVFAVVKPRAGAAVAAAGHSLGEYSAYVTAGTMTPDEAAKLVRRRGELMHDAGAARPGTMAVILGLAAPEVAAACQSVSTNGAVAVPANLNAPDQTVISGDPEAVSRAGDACLARGAKRVLPLKVSGAFHSPLMAPAAEGLREGGQPAEQGVENLGDAVAQTASSIESQEALDQAMQQAQQAESAGSQSGSEQSQSGSQQGDSLFDEPLNQMEPAASQGSGEQSSSETSGVSSRDMR